MNVYIRSISFLLIHIFLHLNKLQACPFDADLETKARESQAVIIAKILGFNNTTGSNRAVIQITQIIKPPNSSLINFTLNKSSPIHVEGFQKCTTQPCSGVNNGSLDCVSLVEEDQNYVLFINHTMDRMLHFYKSVQHAELYRDNDSDRLAAIKCGNRICAPPNARAKKGQQATQGATKYRLTCRATGNPPPIIRWLKDGEPLSDSMKGIKIRAKKRRIGGTYYTSTLRIKRIAGSSAGLYRCIATNFLGSDTAKIKLSVRPIPSEAFTPNPHYVPCPPQFDGHCLNDALCLMTTSFSNLHCSCPPRYTGVRCEEIKATPITDDEQPESRINLVYIVIILACSLAVCVLLLLIAVCILASWCYKRSSTDHPRKSERKVKSEDARSHESRHLLKQRSLLDDVDRPGSHLNYQTPNHNNNNVFSRSVNTQTEDRLEGLFPHTSPYVARRAQSAGVHQASPSVSRSARSRLSGISTPGSHESMNQSSTPRSTAHNSGNSARDTPSMLLAVDQPLHQKLARKTYMTQPQNDTDPIDLHISEESLTSQPNGWGDTTRMPQTLSNTFVNGFSPKSAYDRYQD